MSKNTLFPIFLKTDQAHFLIVGGGNIGLEKTETLLKQNPEVKITIVSPDFLEEVKNISAQNSNVTLKQKLFDETDLESVDFVIAATNIKEINAEIKTLANARKILVNAADQPDLCDFYLGSIVNKGNLKIAISTNGKSPTIAKRLKETLTEALPEQLDDLIVNLNKLRNHLSGDFKTKVNILNKVTENLSTHPEDFDKYISDVSQLEKSILVKRARRIVNNTLLTMGGLLVLVSGFL
jgi:siroheme synthase-like protein